MVHSDAQGGVVLSANLQQGQQGVLYLLQFSGILLVGILKFSESAGRVDVVAGVDAHLLGIACGHLGHMGIEMYVGHKGGVDALAAQTGVDMA